MQRNKNYAIEFYRFLFTIIICLHHFQGSRSMFIMKNGWLGVEFFFIITGYFLYKGYIKESQHSLSGYIKKRVYRLYPEYLAALLPLIIWYIGKGELSFSRLFPEMLMLQNSGIFKVGGYNYPCWYISVIVLGGILLYQMLTVFEDRFIRLGAPVLVLSTYTYLIGYSYGLENWDTVGPFYMPLLRGLAGMTLGILLAAVGSQLKINKILGSVIEIGSLLILLAGTFICNLPQGITLIAVLLLAYATMFSQGVLSDLLNRKYFGFLGEISYSVYLNQVFCAFITIKLQEFISLPSEYLWYVLYVVILLMYSVVIHYAVLAVSKWTKKQRNRQMNMFCG